MTEFAPISTLKPDPLYPAPKPASKPAPGPHFAEVLDTPPAGYEFMAGGDSPEHCSKLHAMFKVDPAAHPIVRVTKPDGRVLYQLWRRVSEPEWQLSNVVALPVRNATPQAATAAPAAPATARVEPAGHVASADRFPAVWADELRKESQTWLIKNVLPEAEIVFIAGATASGKTFLTLDMCGAISRGEDWNGRKVKQATVTYVAAEVSAGIYKRLVAHGLKVGKLGKPTFALVRAAPDFTRADDVSDIIATVNKNGGARRLVVIDTLASVALGLDENSSQMGVIIAECKRIHAETGATVILVAHVGKDSAKGIRGWSGQNAASDTTILVTRRNDARAWSCDKQRDEEDGKSNGFRLERVVIGKDDDGQEVASCFIRHGGGVTEVKPKTVSPAQDTVIQTLQDITDDGQDITRDELITAAAVRTTAGNTPESRKSMGQAVRKLLTSKRLREVDGYVVDAFETDEE